MPFSCHFFPVHCLETFFLIVCPGTLPYKATISKLSPLLEKLELEWIPHIQLFCIFLYFMIIIVISYFQVSVTLAGLSLLWYLINLESLPNCISPSRAGASTTRALVTKHIWLFWTNESLSLSQLTKVDSKCFNQKIFLLVTIGCKYQKT